MISVHVLFVGPAQTFAGTEEVTLELVEGATVADLRKVLTDRYAGLRRGLAAMRIAVNEEFADDSNVLQAGDEIALIPPVCGGSGGDVLARIVSDAIDTGEIRDFVAGDPSVGAIVTFEGTTRQDHDPDHGPLAHLHFEAYENMALKQLERLAGEAKRRWSASRVAIVHRVGRIPVGEAAVVIAVACGHRAEGFEACRWIIDTLKEDVPIWKKNVYQDGHQDWVDPTASKKL